jgi:hypothetical protein
VDLCSWNTDELLPVPSAILHFFIRTDLPSICLTLYIQIGHGRRLICSYLLTILGHILI